MLLRVNFVFVLVPAKIQSLTGNITVDETNPIDLKCEASGYPSPAVTCAVCRERSDTHWKQQRGDSGAYVCMADNGVGQAVQMKALVTVYCK